MSKWFDRLNENTMHAELSQLIIDILWETAQQDTDPEIPSEVRFHFETCGRCEGRGRYVNPSIDGHGLSAEDFAEDPDFADAYFSGVYDITCNECQGRRVVPVPDDEAVMAAYHKHLNYEAAYEAEIAAERRLGC